MTLWLPTEGIQADVVPRAVAGERVQGAALSIGSLLLPSRPKATLPTVP